VKPKIRLRLKPPIDADPPRPKKVRLKITTSKTPRTCPLHPEPPCPVPTGTCSGCGAEGVPLPTQEWIPESGVDMVWDGRPSSTHRLTDALSGAKFVAKRLCGACFSKWIEAICDRNMAARARECSPGVKWVLRPEAVTTVDSAVPKPRGLKLKIRRADNE